MQNLFRLTNEHIENEKKYKSLSKSNIRDIIDQLHQLKKFNGEQEEYMEFKTRMKPIYKKNINKVYDFVLKNRKIYEPDIHEFCDLCWFSTQKGNKKLLTIEDFTQKVELWAMCVAYYEYSVEYLKIQKFTDVNRFEVVQEKKQIYIKDE